MLNDLANKREEFYPGEVIQHEEQGDAFLFTCDNDVLLKVHVLTDEIIRFRFSTEGRFEDDFSYALSQPLYNKPKEELDFQDRDTHFRISTSKLTCLIHKQRLLVRILDKAGNILCEDEKGFHWEWNKGSGGDIVKMSKQVQSSEHYYGLGDKSYNLDLRGRRFTLWGSDTYGYGKDTDPLYKNIPFYISLQRKVAYGIFFDNTFQSFFDFAHERNNVTSFWSMGGEMNYYFIYGPELLNVTQEYTHLTGKPELPPLWALGFHQCKWSYYPEDKVREITDGFRKNKIPCDAIYLDIDYMDGFRCFTWNKKYFPDPKKMVKELYEDGFKTVVIIDPGIKIDKNYSVYKEAYENDYFCRRADGPLMKGSVWPGLCNFPDFTKPVVREWWKDLFKGLIEEDGIRGVWNDMNEPAVFEEGTFPPDVRHDYDGHPCSHRKAHNIYGMQMARATYHGVKKFAKPNRPFVITRSGYSGLQRYTSVWTGDNVASWDHLTIANIQCQRLSVSGVSFTGSDIGGFIETPTGELFIRWIQLGIFHPFCRVHSSGDHGDQEPWSFGDKYTDLARKFIELRYQLLPYIYTAFWQYVDQGTPMLRPLCYLGQKDSETYYRSDEFALGDHILACPITQEKSDGRWLYLPTGQWYYYWTDDKFSGEEEVWADAKLDRIPMYIRAGAVIPFYPVQQYVGEKTIEELTLHVYYVNGEETSMLYEDAGDGYGYEKGEKNIRKFIVEGIHNKLIVAQEVEINNFAPSYQRYKLVLHGLPSSMNQFKLDDNEAVKLDSVTKTNEVGKNIYEIDVPCEFSKIEFS